VTQPCNDCDSSFKLAYQGVLFSVFTDRRVGGGALVSHFEHAPCTEDLREGKELRALPMLLEGEDGAAVQPGSPAKGGRFMIKNGRPD
jgi:hypothetical protein